ncbi:MAG: FUSC family protein, partial [Candidatus Rokuibacteriota bacterium]
MAPVPFGAPLAAFLHAELAPTPGRTRAALRVLVASLVGTVIVMATHVPHGHWIIITIFTVSPEDAGASLVKGIQRMIGTVAGGAVGVLITIAFANEPWFMFVAIGVAVAVGMFLSRTTNAPYASLLGTVTLLLVAFSHLDSPGAELDTALWRTLMILVGVLLGTGAQILLWPSDPEERLLDDLVRRLATVERLLGHALEAPVGGVTDVPGPDVMAVSGFARELDLLANAEARYPALRRRHPEQIALITEVERLLTNALWLRERTQSAEGWRRLDQPLRQRLGALREECGRQRQALAARRPTDAPAATGHGPGIDVAPEVGFPVLVASMEATLARIGAATRFLGGGPRAEEQTPSSQPPFDTPKRAPFFTPAFSSSNRDDIKFALKCAAAVEICLLVILGLDWPGLITSTITCAIVAQSSFGASVYKAFLRLAGAVLGSLLGLAMIVVVMPNAEGLTWMLLPFAAGIWIAAWITAGSSRISYAG